MRNSILALTLSASALCVACGGGDQPAGTAQQKAGATPASGAQNQNGAGRTDIGVVSSHGGPAPSPAATGAGPTGGAAAGAAQKPAVATPELDAKIEQAEAKAKSAGASEAERKAAAAAYFERANFFYNAGNPMLYRFALADYRRGLRYDPNDGDARAKMNEIVRIYRDMGRPVPELGNEP
jgi:hypothetical protein